MTYEFSMMLVFFFIVKAAVKGLSKNSALLHDFIIFAALKINKAVTTTNNNNKITVTIKIFCYFWQEISGVLHCLQRVTFPSYIIPTKGWDQCPPPTLRPAHSKIMTCKLEINTWVRVYDSITHRYDLNGSMLCRLNT